MADRPQVNGWTAINLNKPEEYSSEFLVDGNRYANVTNVSTGQRQLYLVSGLGGTPLTQRSLLTTTNADGTVTQGEGFNSFVRVYGRNKLTNAEINNKRQSVALLANNKVSTAAELQLIKESKEFKSTPVRSSSTPTGSTPTSAAAPGTDSDRVNQQNQTLTYPVDIGSTKQDVIKFTLLEYQPSGIGAGESGIGPGIGGGREDPKKAGKKRNRKGSVILPIPSGISDTNACDWGSNSMNAFEAAATSTAFTSVTEGLGAGIDQAISSIKKAGEDTGTKTGVAALFAAAAGGGEAAAVLKRASGQVINPNMELLFNGPTLRPFSFTFKMSARNKAEGERIIKIIRFFKRGMSPIKSDTNIFLKTPNTFSIQYLYRPGGANKDHPFIGRIKECALQNFTVNYTPEGQYATYSDGFMVSYEMQMQFTELEPVFNQDYKDIPETEIGY